MARSNEAVVFWHDLDRSIRSALTMGATWDEVIGGLRDKAVVLEHARDRGAAERDYRRFERM